MSEYYRILEEICAEEEVSWTYLSDGWVILLEKDGRRKFIVGYKFDLTTQGASLVADDKNATFAVLRQAGIPVIEHELLYEATNNQPYVEGRNTPEYLAKHLQKWGSKMVVKPNNGTVGGNVFCVTSLEEAMATMKKVFHQSYSASICPFYEIRHEYRLILLDGEEQIAYRKTRGKDWRFNLYHGATADKIPNEQLHTKLLALAQSAAKALGLRFCSIDIIQTVDGELLVLEANSGVMAERYLVQHPEERGAIKEMYRAAVRKMFEPE